MQQKLDNEFNVNKVLCTTCTASLLVVCVVSLSSTLALNEWQDFTIYGVTMA